MEKLKLLELMDESIELQKKMKEIKKRIDEINISLETECLQIIEDRNIKSTVLHGNDGNKIIVTKPTKVELLNYERLRTLLGDLMIKKNVTVKESISFDLNTAFKKLFSVIILDDYIKDERLEDFLRRAFGQMDSKQLSVLLKKLKGSYAQDRKLLISLFGEGDYDVELYHITLIKNWDFIQSYLPLDNINYSIALMKDVAIVDEGLKIEYDYPDKK